MSLLALAAATVAVATAQPNCAALKAQAKPTITRANGDWVMALKSGDGARLARDYADDGLFVESNGTVHQGKDAIGEFLGARAQSVVGIVGGSITSQGMACDDKGQIYEWGMGKLSTRVAGGKMVTRGGPYLTVWRREGRTWKIVRNLAF